MLKLTDLGLEQDELTKIKLLASEYKAQSMKMNDLTWDGMYDTIDYQK